MTKAIAKTIIWRLSAKQSIGWRRTPGKILQKNHKGENEESPESRAYDFVHGAEPDPHGGINVERKKRSSDFPREIQDGHSSPGNPKTLQ